MASPIHNATDQDALAGRIATHVESLCALQPDRSPGSPGNDGAVDYVQHVLHALGVEVEPIAFTTVGWRFGACSVNAGEISLAGHPGPYSPAFDGSGPLEAASSIAELHAIDAPGAVLLLHGPIAVEQLTPRGYPWYTQPEHDAILDAIETAAPVAVIAATGKNPATTGGLSPFPLIEDAAFTIPSAYVPERHAQELLRRIGALAHVRIDSERFAAACAQPVGRIVGGPDKRMLITSHLDTKPGTPGALDNATGVAVMLVVAESLSNEPLACTVEFVAFNGEDHYASPGEVAYLDAHPDTESISLLVNVDGAGAIDNPTALSRYATSSDVDALLDTVLTRYPGITPGERWLAGDHAIFAMRGVQALALTSANMHALWSEIAHTSRDTPDRVDADSLATVARFIAEVIRTLAAETRP